MMIVNPFNHTISVCQAFSQIRRVGIGSSESRNILIVKTSDIFSYICKSVTQQHFLILYMFMTSEKYLGV
jgi:hypothetical protein